MRKSVSSFKTIRKRERKLILNSQIVLGRNLVKGMMAEVCKILGIKRLYCTPYSPTTQGLNERIHKELAMIIRQFADKDRLNWDTIVPFVGFAYRNSVH